MSKIRELKEILKSKAAEIRTLKSNIREAHRIGRHLDGAIMQGALRGLREQTRLIHIAYCLLRGRLYEQIEKPREPLKENQWKIIQEVQNAYTEDVCTRAA